MSRAMLLCLITMAACAAPPVSTPPTASVPQSVLLVTIDTLRADAVGAYGAAGARTPALDQLAREGVRVDRAWATAPITLPSHGSILSGLYPPSHGSRHNGVAVTASVPTLATLFKARGWATAAFVSAFPLDRRFGLARGFDVYDDEMPRSSSGALLNERPGADTARRAAAWLTTHRQAPFFLWLHLFDPHAPYGNPADGRDARARYADDIAAADQAVAVVLEALKEAADHTLVIATADHGEAFGEHGETGHSVFVYDTTLRVPLLFRGPGIPAGTVITGDVSLVDVAPTVVALTGGSIDGDGRTLQPAFATGTAEPRALYAESFAPLLDFGWASLRSVRDAGWKYIAAPRPELFETATDTSELHNQASAQAAQAARLDALVARWSGPELATRTAVTGESASRLRSLGYLQGSPVSPRGPRADPKDRIAVASRMAEVTSGEAQGVRLVAVLTAILKDDPANPQAHLRLGYAHLDAGHCPLAEPHLRIALKARMPSADAGLGLAGCLGQAGDLRGARDALLAARAAEPGNPVVSANLGLLALEEHREAEAIIELRDALTRDPLLFQARFGLARAYARSGDRRAATTEAETLLRQLPAGAPQRPEIERFLASVR